MSERCRGFSVVDISFEVVVREFLTIALLHTTLAASIVYDHDSDIYHIIDEYIYGCIFGFS